jgi:gephyrin
VKSLLTRETPGITQLIFSSSITITPFAALSRPITGIRDKTMIITLPGSPKACKENMVAIEKVLPHALDLLLDRSVKKFHAKVQQGETDIKHVGHTCTHRHDAEGHESQTGQSASLDTPGLYL